MGFNPLPPDQNTLPNYLNAVCDAYGKLRFSDGQTHTLNINQTIASQNQAGTSYGYIATDSAYPDDPDAGAGKNSFPVSPIPNPNPAAAALTIAEDLYTENWIATLANNGVDEGLVRGYLTTPSLVNVAKALGYNPPTAG